MGLDYLYDNYLYRLGNIEGVDAKPTIEPKLDELMTTKAFYETAGRLVGLEDKLISYDRTLLTGKEAYSAYITPDNELSKYAYLYLNLPKENDESITKAEAIAYLVRLYGFIDGYDSQQNQAESDCLAEHPYGDEWQVAIEAGFFDSGQSCPDDTHLKGDEALRLITDWLEKFSPLVSVQEATITLFNDQEFAKLSEYGLTENEINIMGYRNVKTLMELFETEIIIEEERQIVIDSFLANKCAPIEDRNSYFCPDGSRAILNLP